MGSVMDQERPWEREEKELKTLRDRVKHAAEFGLSSQLEVLVDEMEMLDAKIEALALALHQHKRNIR